MVEAATVTLPSGLRLGAERHVEAEVRALTGADEALLFERASTLSPIERSSVILSRAVVRLGPVTTVTPEDVRALAVGDREALLLHVRRLTRGERMSCVLTCTRAECGGRMDVDLSVSELLLPPYADAQAWQEEDFEVAGRTYRVRYRLPTGRDVEAAARTAHRDAEAAAREILLRCVDAIAPPLTVPEWPPQLADAVANRMAALDPQAELILNVTCPECGGDVSALFDAGAFLFEESSAHARLLFREVHALAYHYHWSERDILEMPAPKRRVYLELLDEQLAREAGR